MPAVFLVDPDPAIRRMFQAALDAYGIEVRPAGNRIEAIELFRKWHDTISAVVVDCAAGRETVLALRRLAPLVPVILMTADGKVPPDLDAFATFHKPFPVRKLAEVIRSLPSGQIRLEPLLGNDMMR